MLINYHYPVITMGNDVFIRHGLLHTGLRYTQHRIDKVIKEFNDYVNLSNCFEDLYVEVPDGPPFQDGFYLSLHIKPSIGDKLDEVYKGKGFRTYEEPNALGMCWRTKSDRHKRDWYLSMSGKPPCEVVQKHFLEDIASHEGCHCPKEFQGACKDIISILKKHALPRK